MCSALGSHFVILYGFELPKPHILYSDENKVTQMPRDLAPFPPLKPRHVPFPNYVDRVYMDN